MRVYLCGAMAGCSDEQAADWRDEAEVVLANHGITTLNPMDRDYRSVNYKNDPESVLPDLVEEDKIDIEMSDVVLCNYEWVGVGENTGAGTNMEILFAWERAKRVIVVAPEGMSLSPWVYYHSHNVFRTMNDAYLCIIKFNHRLNAQT